MREISDIINDFSPISLKEMESVALMNRTDTKFVLPMRALNTLLTEIQDKYSILEIAKNRMMTYSSLYFDTQENTFYNDHHNGRSNRTKIRIRNYEESELFFFEIKQKDGRGNTRKSRIPINGFENYLSKRTSDFVTKTTSEDYDLSPSIWNNFKRFTLVNKTYPERVTIDLSLTFNIDDKIKKYPDLVIVEVKQQQVNRQSPVVKAMKSMGYNPYSFSKYCIGMISLYENIKYNRFKKKMIRINKLQA